MTRGSVAIAALIVAIPIEILNVRLTDAMFDPGSAPTDLGSQVLEYQWGILHFPGLFLNWVLNIESARMFSWILFGSGYLDTALLLGVILLALGWMLRRIVRTPYVQAG